MSSDDESKRPTAHNASTDTSPADTQLPSRRFESITHDDDEESMTTTGTVRRNRPPAISTTGSTIYGNLRSSAPAW